MEAFESFVAVALETEGLVVSGAVEFPVSQLTRKTAYPETQTHGFEVDLVAARADQLVLSTVKSFLGSQGVIADHVTGPTTNLAALPTTQRPHHPRRRNPNSRFPLRLRPIPSAATPLRGQIRRADQGTREAQIRQWCATQHAGGGPIEVFGVNDVVARVRQAAAAKQYRDNPSSSP